mgnify:CR=1 FL=1
MSNPRILIYGYGNPGRQDDGLGVFLAEEVEKWARENHLDHIRTETNYQLNIEDAAEIHDADIVIFADASLATEESFRLEKLQPSPRVEFTMHAVDPAFILYLCDTVYGTFPEAYVLHLKGDSYEMSEGLTAKGQKVLKEAFGWICSFLTSKSIPE